MDALKNAVDFGVIGLLLVLSIWALAVAVERWLFYRRVDVTQFTNQQTFEIMLTKRLVVIGTVAAKCPVHWPVGDRPRHHADVSHHGHLRDHGGQHNHDRAELGTQSHCGRATGRHSLRRVEQCAPPASHRINHRL